MYEIEDNVIRPVKAERRSKLDELPFSKLVQGQSFHVPADAENNPAQLAKTWAPRVQQAGKRYSARFGLYKVGQADPKGPGVRIFHNGPLADPAAKALGLEADAVPVEGMAAAEAGEAPAKKGRRKAKAEV